MPGPGDDAWTEWDRVCALVWQIEQGLKCPGCGLPLDETTDPEAEGRYTAHKQACHACAAIERRAGVASRTPGSMYFATRDGG